MRPRRRIPTRALLVFVALALAATGCAHAVPGHAVPTSAVTAGADPAALRGTDGGGDDRLTAAVLHDLENYWSAEFPRLAGRGFTPPRAYWSVDAEVEGPLPPCVRSRDEVEGNAFYCARADALTVDRAALVPVLRQQFGDAAVVVVVAHEFGHAVAERLLDAPGPTGPGPAPGVAGSTELPVIVLEAQADCYGAAFVRAVHDGRTPDLRTADAGVDAAMAALVTFRDPLGVGRDAANAHGNAFDRVTSFQTGYEQGPPACAATTLTNRTFTQRAFSTLSDLAARGDLPLDRLLARVTPDLDRFYGELVRSRGGRWTLPPPQASAPRCPGGGDQGPVAWCAGDGTLRLDPGPALTEDVHRRAGDYATVTLLASREGLAALGGLGRPTTGPGAGRTALCLAGAYTNAVGAVGPPALSPGDLDEAVDLLLRSPDAARDADGAVGAVNGYDRIAEFRRGVLGGAGTCLG